VLDRHRGLWWRQQEKKKKNVIKIAFESSRRHAPGFLSPANEIIRSHSEWKWGKKMISNSGLFNWLPSERPFFKNGQLKKFKSRSGSSFFFENSLTCDREDMLQRPQVLSCLEKRDCLW
jgi:hypothetical protein